MLIDKMDEKYDIDVEAFKKQFKEYPCGEEDDYVNTLETCNNGCRG